MGIFCDCVVLVPVFNDEASWVSAGQLIPRPVPAVLLACPPCLPNESEFLEVVRKYFEHSSLSCIVQRIQGCKV